MLSAWRIVLASEAARAFSGEGSRRYGGRWNSPGKQVVYMSEHQSTAAFEIFIHNRPFLPDEKFKAFYLEWPNSFTEFIRSKDLPADWRVTVPHDGRTVGVIVHHVANMYPIEIELAQTTEIFGNVAHRFSSYAKRGTTNHGSIDVRRAISTQFIRTEAGWRISSMAWDDERDA